MYAVHLNCIEMFSSYNAVCSLQWPDGSIIAGIVYCEQHTKHINTVLTEFVIFDLRQ